VKLEKWALIAEIVSSVAIVVTLAILVIEVRTNTAALRASTYRDVVESITSILHERASDAEVAQIWYAGAAGDQLSPFDADRFDQLVTANTRRFENAFYQYRTGGIDPTQWQGVETALRQVFGPPAMRVWWEDNKSLYSLEFQHFVDDVFTE